MEKAWALPSLNAVVLVMDVIVAVVIVGIRDSGALNSFWQLKEMRDSSIIKYKLFINYGFNFKYSKIKIGLLRYAIQKLDNRKGITRSCRAASLL